MRFGSNVHLCRCAKFAGEPALRLGCHRISVNVRFMDMAAFCASKRPVLKSGNALRRALDARRRMALKAMRPREHAWREDRNRGSCHDRLRFGWAGESVRLSVTGGSREPDGDG